MKLKEYVEMKRKGEKNDRPRKRVSKKNGKSNAKRNSNKRAVDSES